mgnify:FL=1
MEAKEDQEYKCSESARTYTHLLVDKDSVFLYLRPSFIR